MSNKEEEYEVESIQEAKVAKGGKGKSSKFWQYRVRWKGYTPEEDTWESIDSFNGSEHIVTSFWERANTGGRNIEDLKLFKIGEIFIPLGPPRRPKRKATTENISTASAPAKSSRVETSKSPATQKSQKTASENATISRPNKRRRATDHDPETIVLASTSSASPQRNSNLDQPPSPEIIPDSDEEMTGETLQTLLTPRVQKQKQKRKTPPEATEVIELDDTPEPHEPFDPLFDQPQEKVPDHIARKENPLVIMVEDPALTQQEGGISSKMRALSRRGASSSEVASSSKRLKPGPGRSSSGLIMNKSSVLTMEKGTLKSRKGQYRKEPEEVIQVVEVVQEEIIVKPPPTPAELLNLAGLDMDAAADLPDFDDVNVSDKGDEAEVAQQAMAVEPPTPVNDTASPVISFPSHNLFSQAPPTVTSSVLSGWGSSMPNSTIFGPLSLGLNSNPESSSSASSPMFLNLDSAVSIPALVTNMTSTEIKRFTPQMESKGTPGKFYSSVAALKLLGTVRSGGVAAQVSLDKSASEEEQKHFKRFIERLQNGDLFVAVAGIHILVFCSAGNMLLSQRLNIPPGLHNVSEAIVVSEVTVENYSGYADATSLADDQRWIQYVDSVS